MATSAIGTTVKAVTAVGTAIGGVATAAAKVGTSFEAEMAKVSAISGATGQDFEDLKNKAKEMGAKTKFSASESAQAMEYMAMAGWKTNDMLGGLEGIMNLAAASGEDLATTSDIVTDALTAFGLGAGEATRFSDVLAQASSNANTNVSMMGETFKYVAPVAGALKFSVEDTALAIGLMANSGVKASQAGTSLRSLMTRLAKPTDEVKTAMKQLGVSLTNSDGSMKSLAQIMVDLRENMGKLSEAEKASMAASLAGQEAMSGLLAIVNASDEDFNKLSDAINNCDGASQRMADTMNDTLTGSVTILKSALEGLGIELYEEMQQPLKDTVKVANGYINTFATAFQEGGVDALLGAVGNVLGDVIARAAEFAPMVVNLAINAIDSFVASLQDNADKIADAAVTIAAAFARGIVKLLPEIQKTAVKFVQSFADNIKKNAAKITTEAINLAKTLIEGLLSALPSLYESAVTIVAEMARGIAEALPGLLAEILPQVVDVVSQILQTILEQLPAILEAGMQIVIGLTQGILDAIPLLVEQLPAVIDGITQFLVDSIPLVINAAVQLLNSIVDALPIVIDSLIAALPGIISSITTFLINAAPEILAGAVKLLMSIVQAIPQIEAALIVALPQIVLAILEGLKDVPAKVGAKLLECIPRVLNWGIVMAQKGKEAGKNFLKCLIEEITGIPDKAEKLFKKIIAKATDFVKNFPEKADAAAKSFAKALKKGLRNLPDDMKETGKNIIHGIWKGISNKIDWLKDKISGLGDDIVDAAKEALGIHSPSRRFAWIGEMCIAGYERPFENYDPYGIMNDSMQANVGTLRTSFATAYVPDTVNAADGFDYSRMGEEMGNAVSGMEVKMDGHTVGRLVAPGVNDELGHISERRI